MSGTVRQIDYGAVYASKSFKLQDNRTVWIGWVYEVRCWAFELAPLLAQVAAQLCLPVPPICWLETLHAP